MRILLVSDFPADARLGSAKVTFKLREELRSLGHECDALFTEDMGPPLTPRLRLALGPALCAKAIAQTIDARGAYDVVDAAGADGFVFGLQRRTGRYHGVAFISRSNGLEHLNYASTLADAEDGIGRKPWYTRVYFPVARLPQVAGAARLADRLLLLNKGDRDFALLRGWKEDDRIDVVPHGVSEEFLNDIPDSPFARGKGILFCGSWAPVKGVAYLAEAYSVLVSEGLTVPLTILGASVPDEVVLGAFAREAWPHVRVLPRASETEVIAHYRTHDIFISSSSYEGFGMVVLEAMSQGMAVIATRVGCAPEVIDHGRSGILIETRSPAQIAGAIRQLVNDRATRERIGMAAAAAVRQFSWQRTARETVATYERAIRQARQAR